METKKIEDVVQNDPNIKAINTASEEKFLDPFVKGLADELKGMVVGTLDIKDPKIDVNAGLEPKRNNGKDIVKPITEAGKVIKGTNAIRPYITGNSCNDPSGLITKWVDGPSSVLAIDNFFYNLINEMVMGNSEDYVKSGLTLAKEGTKIFTDTAKLVHGLFQIQPSETETYGQAFMKEYTKIGKVEAPVRNQYDFTKTVDSVDDVVLTKYTTFDDAGNVMQSFGKSYVDTSKYGAIDKSKIGLLDTVKDGINFSYNKVLGRTGRYDVLGATTKVEGNVVLTKFTQLDDMGNPVKTFTSASNTSKATSKGGGVATKVFGALGVATGVLNVSSSSYNLAKSVEEDKMKPSHVMNLVGDVFGLAGSIASLGGPIGAIVGAVLGGVGAIVKGSGALADLSSVSTEKEKLNAGLTFAGAFLGPGLPSPLAISNCLDIKDALDKATGDIDKRIIKVLYNNAIVDTVPLMDIISFGTAGFFKAWEIEDVRDELVKSYGSKENVVKSAFKQRYDKEISSYLNSKKEKSEVGYARYIKLLEPEKHIKDVLSKGIKIRAGRSAEDRLFAYDYNTDLNDSKVNNIYDVRNAEIDLGVGKGNVKDTLAIIDLDKNIAEQYAEKNDEKLIQNIVDKNNVNNSVVSSISDIIRLNVNLKGGNDNFIVNKIIRSSEKVDLSKRKAVALADATNELDKSNARSYRAQFFKGSAEQARIKASGEAAYNSELNRIGGLTTMFNKNITATVDGGEGEDNLNLSEVEGVDKFEINYKFTEDTFTIKTGNAEDEIGFTNFEKIILRASDSAESKVKYSGDGAELVAADKVKTKAVITTKGTNTVDFSHAKNVKLNFVGSGANNTVYGTDNNDTIVGTLNEEQEKANSANIKGKFFGYDGDDVIKGSVGNDIIAGGIGNDVLFGGYGQDYIYGEGGNDLIFDDEENIEVYGGYKDAETKEDSDTVLYSKVKNGVNVSLENEIVTFASGKQHKIKGFKGVVGTDYNDTITGNSENNIINGGNGDDTLDGKAGNDTIITGLGKNSANGGDGDDTILGGDAKTPEIKEQNNYGSLTLSDFYSDIYEEPVTSQYDIDKIEYKKNVDIIHGDAGNDTIYGFGGDDKLYGGNDNDYLNGGEGDDTLEGGAGDDVIEDNHGSNIIIAGDGNDTIIDGLTSKLIAGGSGFDTLNFSKETKAVNIDFAGNFGHVEGSSQNNAIVEIEAVLAGNGNDILSGNNKDNHFEGNGGNDFIYGYGGDDKIYGGDGIDIIKGGDGADTIFGGNDHDEIYGDAGNDMISAGEGNDLLVGGAGNDMLFGGNGNDIYEFKKGFGKDVIFDPGTGIDGIRFIDIDKESIYFKRKDNDLVISVKDTEDEVTVKSWYVNDVNKSTFLSDIDWKSEEVGTAGAMKDNSMSGQGILINGTSFKKGIGMHSNGTVVYNLEGNYERFKSTIGTDDHAGYLASVVYQVVADGEKIYDSGVMRKNQLKDIDLDVAGKKELKLIVTDAGDYNYSDHGDWGNARLIKSEKAVVAPSNDKVSEGKIDLLIEQMAGFETTKGVGLDKAIQVENQGAMQIYFANQTEKTPNIAV